MLRRLWPSAPITVSNVLGSNQTVPIDIKPAQRDLGFQPCGLVEGLQRVIHGEGGDRLSKSHDENEVLKAESRMLGKYLLGVAIPHELQSLYLQGCRKLIRMEAGPESLFVRRHPWALPCLDGAAGLLRSHSDLRQRVFLMTAIIEATPLYAEFYLSAPRCARWIWLELAVQGVRYGITAITGIPLYFWLRWRR